VVAQRAYRRRKVEVVVEKDICGNLVDYLNRMAIMAKVQAQWESLFLRKLNGHEKSPCERNLSEIHDFTHIRAVAKST
jgi:hypothetical protein